MVIWLLCHIDYAFWCEDIIIPLTKPFGMVSFPIAITFILGPTIICTIAIARRKAHRLLAGVFTLFLLAVGFWICTQISHLTALPDCYDNMRELTLAFLEYQLDHEGRLPRKDNWVDEIYPYVGDWQVFKCPAVRSEGRCSYAMNARLSGVVPGDEDSYVVLLYETTDTGFTPSGNGEHIPSPGRHYLHEYGHVNWLIFPDGGIAPDRGKTRRARW